MKNKQQHTKHIHIYGKILGYVQQFLDKLESPTLRDAIEHAQQQAAEIDEHTREDIAEISEFVQRDLEDAADFMQETGEDLKRWLLFDWALIEDRLWETFSQVADKTLVEQQQLHYRLQRGPQYRSGETIGLGTLQCDQCGKLIHFHKVSTIPPCANCQHTLFSRVPAAAAKRKSKGQQ